MVYGLFFEPDTSMLFIAPLGLETVLAVLASLQAGEGKTKSSCIFILYNLYLTIDYIKHVNFG